MPKKPVVKPLYYYPENADLSVLKEAFEEIQPPFLVKPFAWQPGHSGRVVVLGSSFPYLFDHALVQGKDSAAPALKWALGLQEYEKGPKLFKKNLEAIFGAGVKEITDDND